MRKVGTLLVVFTALGIILASSENAHSNPALMNGTRDLSRFLVRPLMRVISEREVAHDFMMAYFGKPRVAFFHEEYMKTLARRGAISTLEQEALEGALARSEFRLRKTLRAHGARAAGHELSIVRRIMREEFYPTYEGIFSELSKRTKFVADPVPRRSTRELFLSWGREIESIRDRILRGESLAGLNAPGAELALLVKKNGHYLNLDFTGANLPFSYNTANGLFRGAILDRANLNWSRMTSSDFTHARLTRTQAVGVDFRSSVFPGADLTAANLRRADLRGADLKYIRSYRGTDFNGALFDESTLLPFSPSEAVRRGMVFTSESMAKQIVP